MRTHSEELADQALESGALKAVAPRPLHPVVVRLAGLPAEVLAALSSPSCAALAQARGSIAAELCTARRELAEAIGGSLPAFDAAARRFLLMIRRSCFNGREIEMHQGLPGWADLRRIAPAPAERIPLLERRLREHDLALAQAYEHELARERHAVLEAVLDRRFLRGVALGRPGLVRKIRLRASAVHAKPRKWEQSLLRFVTRAAGKLSANSTLTVCALGTVGGSPASAAFRFAGAPYREISLVRLNRPEIEQFQAVLMRHPAVRERSFVGWNESVEAIDAGRHRFVRGGYWDIEPASGAFRFVPPARLTVSLTGSPLDALRRSLGKSTLPYGALLAAHGDEREDIDRLIDLGVLVLTPPWPAHEPRLEQRIAELLRKLPAEACLHTTVTALDEVLARQAGFAAADRPEHAVTAIEEAFSRLLGTVAHLTPHAGAPAARATLSEDVLVAPAAPGGRVPAIFEIAPPTVRGFLEPAALAARFAGPFNLRHDLLHTLAAWWRKNIPGRRAMPLLELAPAFAGLWRSFSQFQAMEAHAELATFDPLHSEALAELRNLRAALLSRSAELLAATPGGDHLEPPRLDRLIQTVPQRYMPLLGCCVFVQPADAGGRSWVLNRIHEGTGRYLSRVTPVLEGAARSRLVDHLVALSHTTVDGEEAHLLEVMHPWGSLVNAHPPQAELILGPPYLRHALAATRIVELGDLTIEAELDADSFRVKDAAGRRLLPVHLSSMSDGALPALLRLLLAFGPGETRGVLPPAEATDNDRVTAFRRLTCGNLVLRRRRWRAALPELRERLRDLSDAGAYAFIQDWRARHGIPDTAFFYERTYHGAIKPQYVDLSSPSLCSLLLASLRRRDAGHLVIEEALPAPADFPDGPDARPRALELLVDSLALDTPGGGPLRRGVAPPHTQSEISEKGSSDGQEGESDHGDRNALRRRSRVGERRYPEPRAGR